MPYLKSKQHYVDLYDRSTVDECRRLLKIKPTPSSKASIPSKKERARMEKVVTDLSLYFITGERYRTKEAIVREWMEKDEAMDKKLEDALPPEINCLLCSNKMAVTHRDLLHLNLDDSVLFMYRCTDCGNNRAFYENGKEFVSNMTGEEKRKAKEDIDNTIADIDTRNKKVNHNLEKDRKRFCLNDKEGQEYIFQQESLKHFGEMLEEAKKETEQSKKSIKNETLSFPEVKKFIIEILDSYNLADIQFGQPEVSNEVKVSFTAIAEDEVDIKKLSNYITENLEHTNWHFLQDNLTYKLGVISGTIQGDE